MTAKRIIAYLHRDTSAGGFTSIIVLYAQFNMLCTTKAKKFWGMQKKTYCFK